MNPTTVHPSKIELDLAFNTNVDNIAIGQINRSTIDRLTNSDTWKLDISNWLEVIRKNQNIKCPKIIRETESFSLGLHLTDDSSIQYLNSCWRDLNEKTDVLSFPILDNEIILPTNTCLELGDIVVSVSTAYKQSIEQNHDLGHELRWLVSHGLLHLLGWDHNTPKKLEEMLYCQEELLKISVKVHHLHVHAQETKDAP